MKHTSEIYGLGDRVIETRSGKMFDPANPVFDIEDIAWSLSHIPRYNGHSSHFYSVATHSILVANIMWYLKEGDPAEGLLHDGVEAYLGDVAAPFKVLFPAFMVLEAALDVQMRKQFGLCPTMTYKCKNADWMALFIEAEQLMTSKGLSYLDPRGLRERSLQLSGIAGSSVVDDYPGKSFLPFLRAFKGYNEMWSPSF